MTLITVVYMIPLDCLPEFAADWFSTDFTVHYSSVTLP